MDAQFQRAHERAQSKFRRNGEDFCQHLATLLASPNMDGTTVHRYQIEAVLAVKNMLDADPPRTTNPSLIVAPTGAGKSGMIVMLPYVLQSNKVLILTPSAIISNQLGEAFGCRQDKKNCFFLNSKICTNKEWLGSYLEDVQVIKKSTDAIEQTTGNLAIVNAQKFGGRSNTTLSMRYRNIVTIDNVNTFFAQFDTLIVDEAHHYPSETWNQIVTQFRRNPNGLNKKIVFLTATPDKIDRQGNMVYIVDEGRTACTITREMCIGVSIRELHFDTNRIDHRRYMHDISEILNEQQETENRFIPQAMVLVKTREEVAIIVSELNQATQDDNFAVGISGRTKTIAKGIEDFTGGKHRVAVTCQVGLEGYDNTRVTLCVIMRKIVTGKIMFSQFVGRCMKIRRDLGKINGEDVVDRNVGRVISYREFDLEALRREYDGIDEIIRDDEILDEDE